MRRHPGWVSLGPSTSPGRSETDQTDASGGDSWSRSTPPRLSCHHPPPTLQSRVPVRPAGGRPRARLPRPAVRAGPPRHPEEARIRGEVPASRAHSPRVRARRDHANAARAAGRPARGVPRDAQGPRRHAGGWVGPGRAQEGDFPAREREAPAAGAHRGTQEEDRVSQRFRRNLRGDVQPAQGAGGGGEAGGQAGRPAGGPG